MNLRMRSIAVTFLAVLAAVAGAQYNFDLQVANMQILQAKAVQRELGVSASQRAAMNRAADENRPKVQALIDQARAAGRQPNRETMTGLYLDLRSKVLAQLTGKQLKRLREIAVQAAGAESLCDPIVAGHLGFSDSLIKRLRAKYKAGAEKAAKVRFDAYEPTLKPYQNHKPRSDAENKKIHAKLDPILKRTEAQIKPREDALKSETEQTMLDMLTAAQRKAWHDIQGKKFRWAGG